MTLDQQTIASDSALVGLVPRALAVREARILIDSLEVMADIGFHNFEVGSPQRLLITVELWLDQLVPPAGDDPGRAWDYDIVVSEIRALAAARRYNLQETLVHLLYQRLAAFGGVRALRVRSIKPDVYPDVAGVGIEIASAGIGST